MSRPVFVCAVLLGATLIGCRCGRLNPVACAPNGPELCAKNGAECGLLRATDACGSASDVDCGSCRQGLTCGADHLCACPETADVLCRRLAKNCGTLEATDACGVLRQVVCGDCDAPAACGAGGVANVCANCLPDSVSALCSRLGAQCGPVEALDNCGRRRQLDCGACGPDEICGAQAKNTCEPAMCEDDGFCWVNPLPQGNSLHAVWASADDDVWAAGQAGTLLHFDGQRWVKQALPTRHTITALWGSARNDVWAVGEKGTILHWNGSAWTSVASPTSGELTALWGLGRNEVRATARDYETWTGAVLRWNGTAWSVETALEGYFDRPSGIWGRAGNDYWVAGNCSYSCDLLHWNGSGLERVTAIDPYDHVRGIWGASADDAWAWGWKSLYHWDGTTWTRWPSTPSDEIRAIWGPRPNDLWMSTDVGTFRWDGVAWSASPSQIGFAAASFHSAAGGMPFAVGPWGQVARYDGARWVELGSRIDSLPVTFGDVWGSAPDDVWVVGTDETSEVGQGRVFRWNGRHWAIADDGALPPANSVWGFGANDVWAGGSHWDGVAWMQTGPELKAMWGATPNDIWGASEGKLHRWDGSTWTTVDVGYFYPAAVFGTSISDVWFAGGDLALHWNGSAITREPKLTMGVRGLWGSSGRDLWAVGYSLSFEGAVSHWHGDAWRQWGVGARPLRGACGRNADEVWAVGEEIGRWNGSAWSHGSEGVDLNRCWVSGRGDVWAVGPGGAILRRLAQ